MDITRDGFFFLPSFCLFHLCQKVQCLDFEACKIYRGGKDGEHKIKVEEEYVGGQCHCVVHFVLYQ